FIMVYDLATRTVKYMAPGVDFDTSPMWMADGKHLVFIRQPGLPCGQQTLQFGAGSGASYSTTPAQATAATGGPGGRRGPGAAAPETPAAPVNNTPGIMRAAFQGGYTV